MRLTEKFPFVINQREAPQIEQQDVILPQEVPEGYCNLITSNWGLGTGIGYWVSGTGD